MNVHTLRSGQVPTARIVAGDTLILDGVNYSVRRVEVSWTPAGNPNFRVTVWNLAGERTTYLPR